MSFVRTCRREEGEKESLPERASSRPSRHGSNLVGRLASHDRDVRVRRTRRSAGKQVIRI